MAKILPVNEFILSAQHIPVIDARSPSEYKLGHFPGAHNIPLLDDEVRVQVGTIYKKEGKEAAVELAFKLVGPQFYEMIQKAKAIDSKQECMVYCWRGGLRSNTLAWVLSLSGFKINLLNGGYKSYRNWVLKKLEEEKRLMVIGGRTGCGKTEILEELKKKSEQVIDLENFANHKGSAFGSLGKPAQPSNQQFENNVAMEWNRLDPAKITWIENESRQIGVNIVPLKIFESIRQATVLELTLPLELRAKKILKDYGQFPVNDLKACTAKLQKRLGPKETQDALAHLDAGELAEWLKIVMSYYDKMYSHSSTIRKEGSIFQLESDTMDYEKNAGLFLNFVKMNSDKLFASTLPSKTL